MKNEKSQSHHSTSLLFSQKQVKDTKIKIPKPKRLVCISIDLDSGAVFIETSSSVRKIEPCSVGYYVHFTSMAKAKRLKKRFEKRPYLIEQFLNI